MTKRQAHIHAQELANRNQAIYAVYRDRDGWHVRKAPHPQLTGKHLHEWFKFQVHFIHPKRNLT